MASKYPKPTALKVLEGNPGKRPLNKREPKPGPGIPACPPWLDKDAKAEWRRIVPQLANMGLLTLADRAVLAGYCQGWSNFVRYSKALSKVRNLRGMDARRLQAGMNDSYRAYVTACRELGLTPSARTRIEVGGQDDDSLEDFLRKGKGNKSA